MPRIEPWPGCPSSWRARCGPPRSWAHAQRAGGRRDLPPIWKGVYTAAQAEEGKVPFTGLCRRCHSDNLEGSERGPALKGESFMEHWEQQDLDRLRVEDSRHDAAGRSGQAERGGVRRAWSATSCRTTGTRPAPTPLDSAALSGIQLVRKPGEERELRSFSVVQVVGCLSQEPERSWQLTQATEPVLTRERASNAEELKRAAARPLGRADVRAGERVAVQADVQRGPEGRGQGPAVQVADKNRVNVSSLQPVGTCSE